MIGGLTSLSLSRTNINIDEKDKDWDKEPRPYSSSLGLPISKDKDKERGEIDRDNASSLASKEPSYLPFNHLHQQSPGLLPFEESDNESIAHLYSLAVRPRNVFTYDEIAGDETEDEDDFITKRNTKQNAQIVVARGMGEADGDGDVDTAIDLDPFGEGENVIVQPAPYFDPFTLDQSIFGPVKHSTPKKGKSRHHEVLPLITSGPVFQRDRCTIMIAQGQPRLSARRKRSYMVASDLSDESLYAIEWGIGTVLRDGDELLIVTVVENEDKVDPPTPSPNPADRARSQPERQGVAYILVRQATSLLQQTRLHATVSCQAWHAKNARHVLLDIADHNNLVMLIVGSRGLSQPDGIPLGSTSHYLIQRCSVPVMVVPQTTPARLAKHRVHVPLVEAGIDQGPPAMPALREMQREGDWTNSADGDGAEPS